MTELCLAVRAVGGVVPTGVILEDRKSLPFVQPLSVEAGNQQALHLREGERRSFLWFFVEFRGGLRVLKGGGQWQ